MKKDYKKNTNLSLFADFFDESLFIFIIVFFFYFKFFLIFFKKYQKIK